MVSVYGLGNPLIDIILRAGHETLRRLEAVPGSMNLVEFERQREVISLAGTPVYSPGGSCANTMRGLAWLAGGATAGRRQQSIGTPAYTGAIGRDENGDRFEKIMHEQGVHTSLARKDVPTGSSAILVTPDFERTMFTFLGACREYAVTDFDMDLLAQAQVFHTTGYMWDTPNQEESARHAMLAARAAGTRVSFDIADPFVANRYRESLASWLPGNIDILFANLEELRSLTREEGEPEKVIAAAERYAPLVVMKIGKDGCLILDGGRLLHVDGDRVSPRDTTGAGDSFAAGFLHALLLGRPVGACGRLANRLASRTVTVLGCDYGALDLEDVIGGSDSRMQ